MNLNIILSMFSLGSILSCLLIVIICGVAIWAIYRTCQYIFMKIKKQASQDVALNATTSQELALVTEAPQFLKEMMTYTSEREKGIVKRNYLPIVGYALITIVALTAWCLVEIITFNDSKETARLKIETSLTPREVVLGESQQILKEKQKELKQLDEEILKVNKEINDMNGAINYSNKLKN